MLKIDIKAVDPVKIVDVEGEIDLYSSPQLREALQNLTENKTPAIIVELDGVSYMDSSGLATLVEAMQNSADYKGRFMLCALGMEVRSVFELSRLDQVFEIYSTIDEALKQIENNGSNQ